MRAKGTIGSYLLVLALLLVACKRDEPATLHVLAAASLTDVLPQVAAPWSATEGGATIEFVFDATSRLAAQIESGAPADVFFSADREWMDKLDGMGLIVGDTRHELLGNRLVVVVPKGGSAPKDVLALRSVGRLALAGASVPAGKYARAALDSLGLAESVAAKIVEGDNVRTALAWVAKGEADAAIVYATDAKIEPDVVVAFELPATSHPPIVYPVAVVKDSKHADAARRFIDHLRTDASQAVFHDAGFAPPP